MDKSKRNKFYYHDIRSKVENPKENHIPKSIKPLEEQKESSPLRISEWNVDPMDEDTTKRESSNQTS